MSLWYVGEFAFDPKTKHPDRIVKGICKKNGLEFNDNESNYVTFVKASSDQVQLVRLDVLDPTYERMHKITKEVVEKSDGLCLSASVSTWYLRGEP